MLAMLAAVDEQWSMMSVWLVVAFFVDGIDGPLARRYDTKTNAPIFDGVLLDLIIDYLTYVFVPAYALFKSDLLPGWTGWIAIIIITFASAMYFADNRMKTKDYSFSGFPGCWNMLVLVLFALHPEFLGCSGTCRRACSRNVLPHPPCASSAHPALARSHVANGTGVDVLCWLGRLGEF